MNSNHPNRGAPDNPARNPTADDWQRVIDHVGGTSALYARIKHRGITLPRLLKWIDLGERCHPATFAYILAQVGLLSLPEDTGHGRVMVRRAHAPVMQSGATRYQLVPVQQVMPGDRILVGALSGPVSRLQVQSVSVHDGYVLLHYVPGDSSSSILTGTMMRVLCDPQESR